jgi:hypothetical protein
VIYRRSVQWYDWYRDYFTWARSPGGNDTHVAILADARWSPDPTYSGTAPTMGYVDREGPFYYAGATIDLDLGYVVDGSPVTFTLYFGLTQDAAHATAAVDADVYSLVETTKPGATTTAVVAYRAGTPFVGTPGFRATVNPATTPKGER